jgi:AmmeMemoRadiSam system protein B
MMSIREPRLPPGWYPRDKRSVSEFLEPFKAGPGSPAAAAVAPHAGWRYSGFTAALAVSSLRPEAETVAVIGGHLPGGTPCLMAPEDGVRTPLGVMETDRELAEEFKKKAETRPDRYEAVFADNTVEVLLPMARYFFPGAGLLWLRFPADLSSYEAGKALAEAAAALGRRVAVVASTDLTHYGDNYGFRPRGKGKAALEWVREVNDAAFIEAVLAGEPSGVLRLAERDSSACSAGAVLGALGFAASTGKTRARLLDYRTSADADAGAKAGAKAGRSGTETPVSEDEIPDSFVGYAAISFS